MIRSIQKQTSKISMDWYQMAKYLSVFIIGLLICKGIRINSRYEYLENSNFVSTPTADVVSVSRNNFKENRVPPQLKNNNKNNNNTIQPGVPALTPGNGLPGQGTMPVNNNSNNTIQPGVPALTPGNGLPGQGTMPVNNNSNNSNMQVMPINDNNVDENNEVTIFPRNSAIKVNSNNFKNGRSPMNRIRNKNNSNNNNGNNNKQAIMPSPNNGNKPAVIPSPNNNNNSNNNGNNKPVVMSSLNNNGNNNNNPIVMPSPNNSSGVTDLATQCREANWIPRNECNTSSTRNIRRENNTSNSVWSGLGLAPQLRQRRRRNISNNSDNIEGFNLNGKKYHEGYEMFTNVVSEAGFEPRPGINSFTVQHGEGPRIRVTDDELIEPLNNGGEPEEPEDVNEVWQCNQYNGNTSDPKCILADQNTREAINDSDKVWTDQEVNANPFPKLCDEPGANCEDMTEDEIKKLWRQSYDGEKNAPWWLTLFPGSILEDIRAPGYEEEEKCNTMIYEDTSGSLEGVMRCHNTMYQFKKGTGIILIIVFSVLLILGIGIMVWSRSDNTNQIQTVQTELVQTGGGLIGGGFGFIIFAGSLFYLIITLGVHLRWPGINSPVDGEGDPEGPVREKCDVFSCPDGYEPSGEEYGNTKDVCCKVIEGSCQEWWESDGLCEGDQVEFTPQAGSLYNDNPDGICCAMSCSNSNGCGTGEECIDGFCYEKNDPTNCEEWLKLEENTCPTDSDPVDNPETILDPNIENCCLESSGPTPGPENCEEWLKLEENTCPTGSDPIDDPDTILDPNKDKCCINTSGTGPKTCAEATQNGDYWCGDENLIYNIDNMGELFEDDYYGICCIEIDN